MKSILFQLAVMFILSDFTYGAFYMEGTVKNLDKKAESINKILLWIDSSAVKSEVTLFQDPITFLYRTDKDEMWIINPQAKTYSGVSETVKKLQDATAMLKTAMKDLPEAQKKEYEKQLKELQPDKTDPIKYKKIASNQKVGIWKTVKYEGYKGKEKINEIWELDQKSPIQPDEMKALKAMDVFSKQMSGNRNQGASPPMTDFKSLIVRVLAYRGKKPYSEFLLTKFQRKPVEAKFFEIPPEFTKSAGPPISPKGQK